MLSKGAPESILARCDHVIADGVNVALTSEVGALILIIT
jgi:hypothetical protein